MLPKFDRNVMIFLGFPIKEVKSKHRASQQCNSWKDMLMHGIKSGGRKKK